jgi:metal-sulfur cluster biosynthetic enzyme
MSDMNESEKTSLEADIESRPDTRETVAQVKAALRGVSDPELGLSIMDLGLVYDVEIEGELARVTMTLTSPGCPAGGQIMGDAKRAAESVEGVTEAEVNLTWKPFWTPDRIDPKVRAMMGY